LEAEHGRGVIQVSQLVADIVKPMADGCLFNIVKVV